MDREQLERFSEQPVVTLDPGEYTLRIEEVQIAEDRLSIRPLCILVGGDSDGRKVCPETYGFHEGGENAAAIRNLYGWGVSAQELTSADGDVKSIGALLEGRLGRVALQQRTSDSGELVNTHEPMLRPSAHKSPCFLLCRGSRGVSSPASGERPHWRRAGATFPATEWIASPKRPDGDRCGHRQRTP